MDLRSDFGGFLCKFSYTDFKLLTSVQPVSMV